MSDHVNDSIRFVYFDMGNILLSFDPQVACQNLARLLGRSDASIDHALYQSGLQDKFEHGSISVDRFVDELAKQLAIAPLPCEPAAILDAMSDMFTPIETMQGIIASVRDAGKGVGLLSNTCRAHWNWIERQNYAVMGTPFDETVLSFDVGSMKPEPQIYEAAEAMCEVDPSEILFIDDRPENVAAAKQRGWNAEVCLGGPEAIAILRRYLVI